MRFRPASGEERQLAFLWGALAAITLALRPLWLALAPLAPPCPFRAISGLPCPSCGTTRAVVALLSGDLPAAVAANPLAAGAAVAFFLGGAVAPLWALCRGTMPELGGASRSPAVRVALATVLVATWAYLLAAGI